MATPNPQDTSNANLLGQAQNAAGTGTGAVALSPVTDISQIPAGSAIFSSGGSAALNIPSLNVPPQEKRALVQQGLGSRSDTQTMTLEQWENFFYTNISSSQSALQQFSTEAQLAGMVKSGATQEQLYAAWQKLLVQSYNHTINGQQQSPWDILANSIPGSQQGSFQNNAGQSFLSGLTQQQISDIATSIADKATNSATQKTSVDINYTDPDTARYLINQASQQLLGRRATNAEIATFTKELNTNEAKFPKMTQTTETTSGTTDTTKTGTASPISPTGSGDQTGQTIVGYDASGNPIYGPTTSTATGTTTAKNVTDTNIMLGEADYTRYGREQLAEDAAMAAPDYGAYQAAGPLYQALLNAIKAPVSGVGSNG